MTNTDMTNTEWFLANFINTMERYIVDMTSIRDRAVGIVVCDVDDAERIARKITEADAGLRVYQTMRSAAVFMGEENYMLAQVRLGLMSELVSLLTEGANDTWSGRGNDLKRVAFDARRCSVAVVQNEINH